MVLLLPANAEYTGCKIVGIFVKSKRGFTIIEVILVLAIAGLIFLIVFLAFPALQHSWADTDRREAARNVLGLLETYKSRVGHYPATTTEQTNFLNNYHTDFKVPGSGTPFNVNFSQTLFDTHNVTLADDQIVYVVAHWCAAPTDPDMVNGDDITKTVAAVLVKLEVGGTFCVDDHGH